MLLVLNGRAQEISVGQMPKLPALDTSSSIDPAKVSDVGDRIRELFSRIDSIKYLSEQNSRGDSYYASLLWKQVGKEFSYSILSIDRPSETEIHEEASFDGKRCYIYEPPKTQIVVRDGLPNMAGPRVFASPLMLYSFLSVDDKFLPLELLDANSTLWKNLISRMSFVGLRDFGGKKCLAVRFSKSFDQNVRKAADYVVYFDATTLLPQGWQSYDLEGYMIAELEVLDLKRVPVTDSKTLFCYPTRYKVTQYQWLGTFSVAGKPAKYYKSVREQSFGDVSINDLITDDIPIDFMQGNSIYDENANRVIAFPK